MNHRCCQKRCLVFLYSLSLVRPLCIFHVVSHTILMRWWKVDFDREKANLLAENIRGFIQFVQRSYQQNNSYLSDPDKLYRLKLLVDEFHLTIIADELTRINKFMYDQKYTGLLVNRFRKAIHIIGDYIDQNSNELFIFTARLHTLRSICSSFTSI